MIQKRKLKDWPLTWKFSFGFIVMFLIPSIFLGSIVTFQMNQIVTKQTNEATNRILNTIENSLNAVMENIVSTSTYMIFSNDFRSVMKLTKTEGNEERFANLSESINGFMTYHLLSKDYINSVTLQGTKGYDLNLGEPVSADESKWKILADEKKGGIVWSSTYPVEGAWHGKTNIISLFRVINDINNINSPIGRVTIRLNEETLYRLVAEVLPKEKGTAFITNQDGIIISHPNNNYIGKLHPDWKLFGDFTQSNAKTTFKYSSDGTNYLVNSRRLEDTKWYLVTIVKEKEVLKDLVGLRFTIFGTILALVILGMLAIVVFYKNIIKPIITLTTLTRQVEKGDFTASIKINTKDEVGELGNRFNKMVKRLQHLIETKYKLQIKQRESELKNLQSQINPHFLYNTLDMIRWTARIEKAFETSQLIELLSRLFRLSLSNGKLWIPLNQEFLHVKTYLELQKRRMGDILAYSVILDAQISDSLVLNQMIQPLVENSIVHGFVNNRRNCKIQVRGYLSNNQIWIEVIDNGIGFDFEKINNEQSSNDNEYALNNIKDRLTAAFNKNYELHFLKSSQPGTWVRIIIPNIEGERKALNIMNELGDIHED